MQSLSPHKIDPRRRYRKHRPQGNPSGYGSFGFVTI